MDDIDKRVIQARTRLLIDPKWAFFGTLGLRLKLRRRDDIPTMSVDGKTMSYNPDFVERLPFDELLGVTAHEIMHCAAGHPMRMGKRDSRTFNEACDYAINPLILAAGFKLPASALIDPEFAGKSAEDIYSILYGRKKKAAQELMDDGTFGGCGDDDDGDGHDGDGNDGDQDGDGQGGKKKDDPPVGGDCGDFTPPATGDEQPLSDADIAELAREWEEAVAQTVAITKKAGLLPGNLVEMFDEVRRPYVDWREQLRRFIDTSAKQNYTWIPPNRRHVANGLYLPALESDGIGELVYCIDTSISMNTAALQCATDELNAIIDDVRPEQVTVILIDEQVHHVEQYGPDDYPVAVKAYGRNGTRFSPAFAKVAELGIIPACLVYFTDLECADFGPEPSYPVLWACTEAKATAPWGEVIRVVVDH